MREFKYSGEAHLRALLAVRFLGWKWYQPEYVNIDPNFWVLVPTNSFNFHRKNYKYNNQAGPYQVLLDKYHYDLSISLLIDKFKSRGIIVSTERSTTYTKNVWVSSHTGFETSYIKTYYCKVECTRKKIPWKGYHDVEGVMGLNTIKDAQLKAIGIAFDYFKRDFSEVISGPDYPKLVEVKECKIIINETIPYDVINYIMYVTLLGKNIDIDIDTEELPVDVTKVDPDYLIDEWNILKALERYDFKVNVTGGPSKKDPICDWVVKITKPTDKTFIPIECKATADVRKSLVISVAATAAIGIEIGQPNCSARELLVQVVPKGMSKKEFLRRYGIYN